MERKVGKPKLKSAFVYAICVFAFSWFLFDADAWGGIREFAIVLDIILFVIVIPGIVYCQIMWKVDEHHISYTYYHTFFHKVIGFYEYILHQKHLYQVVLNLNQIDYIDVTYHKVERAPFGSYGYDLLFIVHMYDGSEYEFEALVTRDRKAFCQAVDYLKNQGIVIKDPLKILDYLNTGGYLSYYLEELERNEHD